MAITDIPAPNSPLGENSRIHYDEELSEAHNSEHVHISRSGISISLSLPELEVKHNTPASREFEDLIQDSISHFQQEPYASQSYKTILDGKIRAAANSGCRISD